MQYSALNADMFLRDNVYNFDNKYFIKANEIYSEYGAYHPYAGQLSIENEKSGVITLVFSRTMSIFVLMMLSS